MSSDKKTLKFSENDVEIEEEEVVEDFDVRRLAPITAL